jgi:hypothetical protein
MGGWFVLDEVWLSGWLGFVGMWVDGGDVSVVSGVGFGVGCFRWVAVW